MVVLYVLIILIRHMFKQSSKLVMFFSFGRLHVLFINVTFSTNNVVSSHNSNIDNRTLYQVKMSVSHLMQVYLMVISEHVDVSVIVREKWFLNRQNGSNFKHN